MGFASDPRKSAFLLVVAIATATALAGCYTVLKHPPTLDLAGGDDPGTGDCFSCHGSDGPGHPYDPLFAVGFDYFNDYWYPFYAYPWWYRDYWYYDRYDHSGGGGGGAGSDNPIPQDDSRRHLWGRGGSGGSPSLPPVYTAPNLPGTSTGTAGAGAGGGPAAPPPSETGQQPGRTMKDGAVPPSTPPPPPPPDSGGQGDGKQDKNEEDSKKKTESKKDDRKIWSRGGGRKS